MESRALQALARGCKLLVEINLNDCGNCVDADAMKAFAENCHDLQRVAINRNPKVPLTPDPNPNPNPNSNPKQNPHPDSDLSRRLLLKQ